MSSERQLFESESRWWGEHIHRYKEALVYTQSGRVILDIACGTGFGTDILAQHSTGDVYGGDIDAGAIQECQANWKRANIHFKVMDGTRLDFSNEYFDAIVSFETIEHTTEYKKMVAEFFRVLKPGGYLIVSTPNAKITSPDGVIENRYHTQEFTSEQLQTLLGGFFNELSIYGQRYKRYDNRSVKNTLGKFFETVFLSFGIRKLPYSLRNSIMNLFFGYNLYPVDKDFVLEKDLMIINKNCPVLFAVCKK
mgnify:FL=1